jgi:hypothetical protein
MTLEPVIEAEPVPPLEETELMEDAGGLVCFSIFLLQICKYSYRFNCWLVFKFSWLINSVAEPELRAEEPKLNCLPEPKPILTNCGSGSFLIKDEEILYKKNLDS